MMRVYKGQLIPTTLMGDNNNDKVCDVVIQITTYVHFGPSLHPSAEFNVSVPIWV